VPKCSKFREDKMKYSEFIEKMKEYGWERRVFSGHTTAIRFVGFVHIMPNKVISSPLRDDVWDAFLWLDDIKSKGYDKVIDIISKRYPKVVEK